MEDYELRDRIAMLEAKVRALESYLGVYCEYKPESFDVVKVEKEPNSK